MNLPSTSFDSSLTSSWDEFVHMLNLLLFKDLHGISPSVEFDSPEQLASHLFDSLKMIKLLYCIFYSHKIEKRLISQLPIFEYIYSQAILINMDKIGEVLLLQFYIFWI